MIVQGYLDDHSNYWKSGNIILPDNNLALTKIKDKSSVQIEHPQNADGFHWASGHFSLSLSQADSLFLMANPRLQGSVELVKANGLKYIFHDCLIKSSNIDTYLVGFRLHFETSSPYGVDVP